MRGKIELIIFLFTFSYNTTFSQDCNPISDSLALVELYNATGGNEWTYTSLYYSYENFTGGPGLQYLIPNAGNSWNFSQPMNTWHGVELNDEGCVVKLSLIRNNLTGALPDLNLPNLEVFVCNDNTISGILPNFSNLTSLTHFIASYNAIEGIPAFNNLPVIDILHLGDNDISGNIPDFDLPSLKQLFLFSNAFSGNIPDFSGMPNLEIFFGYGNMLDGSIPDFSNLSLLEWLWISNNNLEGAITNFSSLENLTIFLCGQNNLEGSIPDFSNLPLLEEFACYDNELDNVIPDFSNLPKLKFLSCSDNNLIGPLPNFTNLAALERFNCDNNNIDGSIPNFDNLPNLEWLFCYDNQLSGSIPDFNLPNLSSLKCEMNQLTGEIPDFSGLPNLQILTCNNNQLEGSVPDFSSTPFLTGVNCSHNNLSGTIPDFSNLPILYGFQCEDNNLTGSIPNLSDNCPALRFFWVDRNQLTFEDILGSIDANETIMASNYQFIVDTLGYAPQDSIFMDTTITIQSGSDLDIPLGIDPQVTSNIYQWYKDGNSYVTANDNVLSFSNIQTSDAGQYWVHITNSGAPKLTLKSHTITLLVESTEAENYENSTVILTPNGDGLNDAFIIDDILNFPKNEVIIFNRWGSTVFQAKPYQNDWQGQGQNGKLLPEGTYYYEAKLDVAEKQFRHGAITIKR